jgi:V/A-type H+-transporting ATPase subunit E
MESEVQRIIDHIFRGTRENAESILIDANNHASMEIEKQKELAYQKSKGEVFSILKSGEEEAESFRRTLIADAKRIMTWKLLSEKERLVTSVLDEVKTRLRVFSNSENYTPFLQKLIIDSGICLNGGALDVLLSEQDTNLLLNLDMLTKTIIEKTGKWTELTISNEKLESLGGFVIRRRDGKIVINNTFSVILKRRERDLRFKIAKILFH